MSIEFMDRLFVNITILAVIVTMLALIYSHLKSR